MHMLAIQQMVITMGKVLGALFGGSPKTSAAPVQQTEEDKKKAKKAKQQVLATQGGIRGEELQAGQTSTTDNLFGN